MGYRMTSPRRAADVENTNIVNNFLDKYFYTKENGFERVERVEDKGRQISGIDVEFDFNGVHMKCDEKAATSYINKGLKTFSFEVAFVNKNDEIMDGWLLNEDIVTEYYVLVWIDGGVVVPFSDENDDITVLTGIDGIKDAEIALVKKDAVIKYLKSIGWGLDFIRKKCDAILEDPDGQNMGNVWKNGCKFTYSRHLVEEPVNVLIPRYKLIEMSDFHMHYTS